MSEVLYDAISKANDEGVQYIGTCTLVLGDGTQKVEFKNGRAKVPAHLAGMVSRHGQIDVLGYQGKAPAATPAVVPGVLTEFEITGDDRDDTIATQAVRIAELEAALANNAAAAALEGFVEATIPEDDTPPVEGEVSEEVRLAMEHLAAEGEDVPEPGEAVKQPAPIVRDGFEAQTGDGVARCQAVKADKTQCANPAVGPDGACRLGKHQEQLAA